MLAGITACEEEVICTSESSEEQIVNHNYDGDSVLLVRRYTSQGLSKGYRMQNSNIETAYVTSDDGKYTYKVMKVYRRNSNHYFYIMMENLDCPYEAPTDTQISCWTYGGDESNAKTYGRLYTWEAANALRHKFSMDLAKYAADGVTVRIPDFTCFARLMNKEDVLDLLESDTIGNLYYNSISLNDDYYDKDSCYYDAFVFGTEHAHGNEANAYHSLGGMRDMYYTEHVLYEENHYYWDKNKMGHFWTSEKPGKSDKEHIPLHIMRRSVTGTVYEFVAFWNAGWDNRNGFSVRYVFEPSYARR